MSPQLNIIKYIVRAGEQPSISYSYLLQIILMQQIASPERSRSIKLKVCHKIFPQDFFKRPSSQSPTKQNNKVKSQQQSPDHKTGSERVPKNEVYWENMRQQLQLCRDLSKKDRIKQIQRIWVYSEKKNRSRPDKDPKLRFQSRQESRSPCRQDCQVGDSPAKKTMELKEGLFTFFGKSPTKGLNIMLPPIK